MIFYPTTHSIITVVALFVLSILLVPCILYKVTPSNIYVVSTLIVTCTKLMLCHIASVIICFDQLILINLFEYVIPSTYALALPVIQMNMDALKALLWIKHELVYCDSVLTFLVIKFQTELGYMELQIEQRIHT